MAVKIVWGTLLGIWLVLVIAGKGGFVHILLLSGISVLAVDLVSKYRGRGFRQQKSPADKIPSGRETT